MIKPVGGGINDAGIIRADLAGAEGIVIAHGICPRIVQDSYNMAMLAFDEAVRNALAAGGRIGYMAALDNFSWPDPIKSDKNPDGEYKLAQLVRACLGVYEASTGYKIPLVSGKDSMKNDYYADNKKYSILPTLLITVIAKIDDVHKALTSNFKAAGDYIYVLGKTSDELGGSEYYKLFNGQGNQEPKVDLEENFQLYRALGEAIEKGMVASAHDISDGGLAVAFAECTIASQFGADMNLASLPRKTEKEDVALFSETPGRFVVSVKEENKAEFERIMDGMPCALSGRVRGDKRFIVRSFNGEIIINENVEELQNAWGKGVC